MARFFRVVAASARASVLLAACTCAARAAEGPARNDPPPPPLLSAKAAFKLITKQVKPDYPTIAKLNYIQGPVHLQLTVTREGKLAKAHVLRGHPLLAAAALEAVRHWRYKPLPTRSGPSGFRTVVELNFALQVRKLRPFPTSPEKDFVRQVRPPVVADGPGEGKNGALVRMRVLVSEDGHVLDAQPLAGDSAHFHAAQEIVHGWIFRPARWGTIAVPWYLEVDVPI